MIESPLYFLQNVLEIYFAMYFFLYKKTARLTVDCFSSSDISLNLLSCKHIYRVFICAHVKTLKATVIARSLILYEYFCVISVHLAKCCRSRSNGSVLFPWIRICSRIRAGSELGLTVSYFFLVSQNMKLY